MSSYGKLSLEYADELRQRVADKHCPDRIRTGEHNWMPPFRHWFRRYLNCATCGYVRSAATEGDSLT